MFRQLIHKVLPAFLAALAKEAAAAKAAGAIRTRGDTSAGSNGRITHYMTNFRAFSVLRPLKASAAAMASRVKFLPVETST